MVASGQLAPGAELPSVRELALEHAVNPMTVSKAYSLLEAEGLLERMLGFTPPSTGSVSLFGHPSLQLPGAVKSRVGFVPQQDELLDELTVADQLRVIASFYSHWDGELIDRLCREWNVNSSSRI